MYAMKAFFKRFREAQRPFCTMVVAAAGSSQRMGGENKLLLPLDGVPVLCRTLWAVDRAAGVDEIILAVREEDLLEISGLCRNLGLSKPVKVVRGGEDREQSVYLASLEADPRAELLAVQDGDRPLVTPELIDAGIDRAAHTAAAAPAVPVKDTVKVAHDGIVTQTPDRSTLWAVQTPQVFDAQLLKAALQSALEADAELTDDCSAVERMGKQVYLVEGSYENIKITTPVDLAIAEAILQSREEQE